MNLKKELSKRMHFIQKSANYLNKLKLSSYTQSVRAAKHGKTFQYFLRSSVHDKTGKYVKTKDLHLVKPIIQAEYEKKAIASVNKELKLLKNLINFYEQNKSIEDIFTNFPEGKQAMTEPVVETSEQFLNKWMNKKYTPLPFKDDDPEYFSKKDERMRSKSELLISGIMIDLGIHYVYEMPLKLKNGITIHPDFTIIDAKNGRILYYEHFGLMDNENYVNNAISKILEYQACGYYLGESLLVSFESSQMHLDTKAVQRMLEHFVVEY